MCILIQHPANTAFTDELLLDFYQHNPDGFGAVYAENGELVVIKTLGKPDEIKAIYHEVLKGRECIIHYRMKTHGDIDLDNCHPYHVTDDIWMAHNGILSMGNPIDPRRSDTWHFIEYILRPALTANPELLFDVDYQDYIGDMIGTSNKFAFMHSDGRSVIINESAGVNHEGAWLSNTYAWSAAKYGHGFKSKHNYDWYTGKGNTLVYPNKHSSTSLQTWTKHNPIDTDGEAYGAYDYGFDGFEVQPKTKVNYRKALRAAYNCYRRGSHQLLDWVIAAPEKAEYLLLEWYGEMYKNEMSEMVNADPEEAVALLQQLFDDGSVSETDLL